MALPCASQKVYKPIKVALKAKNYKEAIQNINKLRADSAYKDDPKLCLFSIEANKALNDAENTKIYLKTKYDTLSFFSTTHQLVKEALLLDSIETQRQDIESKKPKQKHMTAELIQKYYPNLQAAARYYYHKKNYKECLVYLRNCLDIPQSPLAQQAQLKLTDENKQTCATLYLLSAYYAKNFAETHRYETLLVPDSTASELVLKYYTLTASEEKDKEAFEKYALRGWISYPKQPFFFTHLVDYYNKGKQYAQTLTIAKKQQQLGELKELAYMAQCIAYFETSQYDSCITKCTQLLQCDTTQAEAHYYLGVSYVTLADKMQMPERLSSKAYRQALEQRQSFYKKAEPELETYRARKPEAKEQWAPLLYKVYLALNRGSKFAEIERML